MHGLLRGLSLIRYINEPEVTTDSCQINDELIVYCYYIAHCPLPDIYLVHTHVTSTDSYLAN